MTEQEASPFAQEEMERRDSKCEVKLIKKGMPEQRKVNSTGTHKLKLTSLSITLT